MARFPEADARLLSKKICMKCGAVNGPLATRCRRCRRTEMRVKARDSRGM